MMKRTFYSILLLLLTILALKLHAQEPDPNNGLKHRMTPEEAAHSDQIGLSFVETDPPPGIVRNVEEFGPTESVLIRYPFGIPMSLIKEMAKDCKVVTIVSSSSQQATVNSQYQSNGVNTANCLYLIANSDSYWTRDYGPWYVTYGNNQVGIVDFPYNRPRPNDDEIPKKVAQMQGIEWFGMNVIHTGGNYMTNGIDQASSTTLVWEENPSQTHEQIAQKMDDYLGIETYMVQEDPNGTYIDHIDCWGKFLGPDKILIRKVPANHPRYTAIEATAAFYASQISSYGTPYRVYRVNTPNDEPYTNSYIMNNKVFIPYKGTSMDAGALLSYQQAMPGYQITGYLALQSAPWESTDALHCRTHEMADRGMLHIAHFPLHDTLPAQSGYAIHADITAYSQQAIYSDSVWVIYKVNAGAYDTLSMVNTGDNHYSAIIPGQMEGSAICYYIHARDASGRRASHPFIGAPDPHIFRIGYSNPADVVVSPDTLIFETFEDMLNGKTTLVRNYSPQSVVISQLDPQGYGQFSWYIDPWQIAIPYEVASGDTLPLTVKISIPVAKTDYLADTLFIGTELNLHKVILLLDPTLLSGVNDPDPVRQAVMVYPNPASDKAKFSFRLEKDALVNLEIFTVGGNMNTLIRNMRFSEGDHSFTWNIGDSYKEGMYYYRFTSGEKVYTGKISIIR